MTELRELSAAEAGCLAHIDRSEHVDGEYRLVDGELQLVARRFDAPSWSAAECDEHVQRLTALIAAGGVAFGAWDAGTLVGFASLDGRGVGGDAAVLKLDMLYVSAGHRGRGLGRALTEQACARARARGAHTLYLSATPTRRTVEAYLRLGARLASHPDPALCALEPDDIHLVLPLARP